MNHPDTLSPHQTFRLPVLLVFFTWAALYSLRLAAPQEVMDNDQERPIAYVMDVVLNGDWVVQTDNGGDITSKPPFYTWLAAVLSLATGSVNIVAMTLPAALATLAAALLVLLIGARPLGTPAALAGALIYLLSTPAVRQVYLIRTDGLFTLCTFAAFLAAFFSAQGRWSWVWFWVLCGLGTLAKLPLVVPLAGGALLAAFWERKTGWEDSVLQRRRKALAEHAGGFALFVLIAGGWFLAAYLVAGQALLDKMIGRELVRHATESEGGAAFGSELWKAPLFVLPRFLPWSLLLIPLAWRLVKRPAANPEARLLERMLAVYLVFGTFLFALFPHKRGDHYLPLYPAAALLAGLELVRWLPVQLNRRWAYRYAGALAIFCGAFGAYYFVMRPFDDKVRRTEIMQSFAAEVRQNAGEDFPFTNVDIPMGFLFYYGEMPMEVSRERAAKALEGDVPVFLLVEKLDSLKEKMSNPDKDVFELKETPLKDADGVRWSYHPWLRGRKFEERARGRVVSNHPRLEVPEQYVVLTESLRIEARKARLVNHTQHAITVRPQDADGRAVFRNESENNVSLRVRWESDQVKGQKDVQLAPGETFVADREAAWQ